MDYTTVPRSLIYRERRSMEEFGAYEEKSITRPLAEAMLRMDFIQYSDSENRALWCMNTAFYICTMVLLEKDPRWRISKYKSIAMPKWNYKSEAFLSLTLSLTVLLLSRLEDSQHISTKKGQTINDFISLMMNEGISNYIFKQLHERVEVDKYIKGTIPNTTFAPRVIDKECIHDVMSDTAFNWVNFTKYWEERSIRDIIKCFGISEDEKHNVIDILRQSSHGFYSAGCNDRPEQVDAMLDDLDEEIRLQFNPGADKTLTGEVSLVQQPESNDEEENLSTNQKEKDRLISELREENKSLTNEVNRLKLENDELHQNQSEGGEEEWIECFDGFLHSSLNPQAIAKALEGITHSYFPKHQRGYWWVFATVLTEIGWIPQTNYKLVLQWTNLHYKSGWEW